MTSHYFTHKPDTEHDYRQIEYEFRGRKLMFMTDANVFSRDRVDFGTSLLIQTMDIGKQDVVLDIGCGYGPIGICAALFADEGKVLMVDVNDRAVALANQNILKNRVPNAEAMISDGTERIPEQLLFNTVLTNPPIRAGKDVVFRIYEEAYSRLMPGGSLWVVIQKKQGADSTEKKLKELFSEVLVVNKEKGYRIYKATKLNT